MTYFDEGHPSINASTRNIQMRFIPTDECGYSPVYSSRVHHEKAPKGSGLCELMRAASLKSIE
jgi:hypothetical protein